MPPLTSLVLPVTAAVALLGLLVVLWWARRAAPRGASARQRSQGPTMQMECRVCQKQMVFAPTDLVDLSPSEIALVVRIQPSLVGKKLKEYVCPYCESSHCFVAGRTIEWVAVNSYSPQTLSANCMECSRPFVRPPWPRGQYDGRVHEVPQMRDEYGLVCSRCGARCCIGCCRRVTPKNATEFQCPRCRRTPIQQFFHF